MKVTIIGRRVRAKQGTLYAGRIGTIIKIEESIMYSGGPYKVRFDIDKSCAHFAIGEIEAVEGNIGKKSVA